MYRHYPFDSLLPTGAASAGSTSAAQAPMHEVNTGLATATPQQRAREACERYFFPWALDTFDGDYWEHAQYISCYIVIGVANATIVGSKVSAGIYLTAPAIPTAGAASGYLDPSNIPLCMLRYRRDDIISGANERFELLTSPGDGVTATLVTVLAGVDPPRSPISPGGARGQRYEMYYKPGEYVAARIDGVEGARHTTALPNPATVPAAGANLAGIGVYLQDGNINDTIRASFYTLNVEMYRDY